MDFEKPRSQNTSILREYKKVHAELKKLKEGMNSQINRFTIRLKLFDRPIPKKDRLISKKIVGQ